MSEASIPTEIDIRGASLKLSITIEITLMSIVYFSNLEQYAAKGAKSLKLRGCMFSQKITRVREMIETFHPDLLEKNSQLFTDLEAFKDFRNLMAHCAFSWGNSISNFQIWDIYEDDDKFQFYRPIEYSVVKAFQTIDWAVKQIIPPLTILKYEIEDRLKIKNEHIYRQLKSESSFP